MRKLIAIAFLCFAAEARADETWDKIHAVLSHPRCANCHSADDHPRWFNAKTKTFSFHAMNVMRGADGMGNPGLRCTTCHGPSNAPVFNGPPGAPNWHLAPASMAWNGKTSTEICASFKDPALNGNRTIEQLATHVKDDKLVAWGWAPGGARAPAPGSAQELSDLIIAWGKAGMPCP